MKITNQLSTQYPSPGLLLTRWRLVSLWKVDRVVRCWIANPRPSITCTGSIPVPSVAFFYRRLRCLFIQEIAGFVKRDYLRG